MDKEEKKPAGDDTSSEATVERGKKAVDADERINRKDPEDPKVKDEKAKDAERWRNEG